MKDLTTQEQYDLEEIIDRVGLDSLVDSIGQICREKADHVRSNWQDESLASLWDKSAETLEGVACCAPIVRLP